MPNDVPSFPTLAVQPFEQQLKQQHTQHLGYSSEDLASEHITKKALKELKDFKTAYWLARANDWHANVSFIETKKKDCALLAVFSRN